MVNFGGRSAAFVLVAIIGFTLFGFFAPSSVSAESSYIVTVQARCDRDATEVAVSIFMDGIESGYSTPHTFVGLTGFHNFSVANEHAPDHFIKQPPVFPDNLNNAIISAGVNWVIIGPPESFGDEATVEFTYSSVPFVEGFRDAFEPGTIGKLGITVHMDPTRVSSGHLDVYDHDWPVDVAILPFYSSDFAIRGGEPTYEQFEIPANASTGSWGYVMRIEDTSLSVLVNSTFEVAHHPTTSFVDFLPVAPLPYSKLEIEGTRYALFENASASAVVLYVAGGAVGAIGGPTPINGYSDIADMGSGTYRLVYDLVTHGFSVVTPLGPWEGLSFPSEVVGYLRSLGMERFYAIGHSAGGVVIAHTIINDPFLFSKAVIADAPLTKESTGFYFTALSIRSESARAQHLLVWGRGDQQVHLNNAYAWMDHANQTLATLRIFDYDHDWAGTTAETQVREQIVRFLTGDLAPRKAPGGLPDDELPVASTTFSEPLRSESSTDNREILRLGNLLFAMRSEWGAVAGVILVSSLLGIMFVRVPMAAAFTQLTNPKRVVVSLIRRG